MAWRSPRGEEMSTPWGSRGAAPVRKGWGNAWFPKFTGDDAMRRRYSAGRLLDQATDVVRALLRPRRPHRPALQPVYVTRRPYVDARPTYRRAHDRRCSWD